MGDRTRLDNGQCGRLEDDLMQAGSEDRLLLSLHLMIIMRRVQEEDQKRREDRMSKQNEEMFRRGLV